MTDTGTRLTPHGDSRIEYLTPIRSIAFPDEWYEINAEEHFWFEWRARAANAMIRRTGLAVGQFSNPRRFAPVALAICKR